MESAIFNAATKGDLKILVELAKKLGIKAKYLSEEDLEDFGLTRAIKIGKTGESIDTESFIDSIK